MRTSTAPAHRHTPTLPIMVAMAALSTTTMVAGGGGGDTTPGTATTANASTADVLCSYSSNAFNAHSLVNPTSTANWSCIIRTARSRTSGENLFDCFMDPSSLKQMWLCRFA